MTTARLLTMDRAIVRRGTRIFGPFSLQIEAGERIAVLGPSGAGKSTLLKLMAREWSPDAGLIRFQDQPLADWKLEDLSRRRAVLPQTCEVAFGLPVDLTIGLGRVTLRHDPRLSDVVREAAALAHAEHLLERRFDTLSGGEKARVQLARIFAQLWDQREGLILVDEPLAALDPGLQFDILAALDAYASMRRHAVVAVLHDINQAFLGFDRLLLVKDGSLSSDLTDLAQAVPALESLYDIVLTCVSIDAAGVVVALRPSPHRKAACCAT